MLLSDPAENQEEAEAEEEDEGKTSDFLFTFKDVSLFYYPAHVALPTQNEPAFGPEFFKATKSSSVSLTFGADQRLLLCTDTDHTALGSPHEKHCKT